MKKIGIAALTIVMLLSTSMQEASAHRKRSKIHGPFGSWTWGPDIPHIHPPSESSSSSCLSVYTPPAEYKVENRTGNRVIYYVNNRRYELSSGYHRIHKIGGGSNSCNTTSTTGRIEFDGSYSDGYQRRSYALRKKGKVYFFSRLKNGNGIDLYLD